jgi:hypothetical protein
MLSDFPLAWLYVFLYLYYIRFELSTMTFTRTHKTFIESRRRSRCRNEVINHETNTYVGVRRALLDQFPDVNASTSIGGYTSDNVFMWYEKKVGQFSRLNRTKRLESIAVF